MPDMRGQQKHRAFLEFHAAGLAALHRVQVRIALELVEEFFVRVVVEIGALVRAADDGDDKIGIKPDLLVAHRGFEQVLVAFDPLREIDGGEHVVSAVSGLGFQTWVREERGIIPQPRFRFVIPLH